MKTQHRAIPVVTLATAALLVTLVLFGSGSWRLPARPLACAACLPCSSAWPLGRLSSAMHPGCRP